MVIIVWSDLLLAALIKTMLGLHCHYFLRFRYLKVNDYGVREGHTYYAHEYSCVPSHILGSLLQG